MVKCLQHPLGKMLRTAGESRNYHTSLFRLLRGRGRRAGQRSPRDPEWARRVLLCGTKPPCIIFRTCTGACGRRAVLTFNFACTSARCSTSVCTTSRWPFTEAAKIGEAPPCDSRNVRDCRGGAARRPTATFFSPLTTLTKSVRA
jgi:hypothetical protein